MIELIFALVIMGVIFITLPVILLNEGTNVERNLMQEAIFASATKISQILTYSWDENSAPDTVVLASANVVEVTSVGLLDRNSSDFRVGHVPQALHRRMTPASAIRSATAIGMETDDNLLPDDIDDFNDANPVDLTSLTGAAGYKKAYRVTTTVSYVDDYNFRNATSYASGTIDFTFGTNPVVGTTTNLKMIEISTDQNNSDGWSAEPILVLRSYSANIGETDFYKRTY
jgi:hypothetical protein